MHLISRSLLFILVGFLLSLFFFAGNVWALQEATITVPSSSYWVNTGLKVNSGNQLNITATGSWTAAVGVVPMVGPDGASQQHQDNFLNLTDFGTCCGASTLTPHWQALIGYIGSNPPYPGSYFSTNATPNILKEAQKIFVIGSNYSGQAIDSGNLWLNFNDDAYSGYNLDNRGQVTAQVKVISAKTPLLLIPGIAGSELKTAQEVRWSADDGHGGTYAHTYPPEEVVWVNTDEARALGNDDYFDILRMSNNGQTDLANLVLTGNLYGGAYQPTINFFTSNGYTLNKDLFVFPYDWRKDIFLTASLLNQKIDSVKQQTSSEKVDIVAHSMGGLAARNYINDPARAQKVRKLFVLGTPHLGSPKFLKALRYGTCLTDPRLQELLEEPICLGVSPSEVKDVIRNMISGFQLAPSQAYFNFYSNNDRFHPYPYKTEVGALNYNQIKDLLTAYGHNTALFNPSEAFHSLDSTPYSFSGVDVTVLAGSGQPTLGQLIERKTTSLLGMEREQKDIRIINGDDTVPLFSASLIDPSKHLSYLGTARAYYTNQKHGKLVDEGAALNLVKNLLEGNNSLPEGVADRPYSLPRIWLLSVHSPVDIHVYDADGNYTGPTEGGDFEADIPGSNYDTLGDAKFVYLPENGVYNIKFKATGEGNFDFKISQLENGINTKTILYKEIPLTDNTEAEIVFETDSTQIPVIKVDENGDGVFDFNAERFSILEGEANYDYVPPTISFEVNPKIIWPPNNKMIGVNIVGKVSDENPYSIKILVDDEYDLVEPSVILNNQTDINQTIKLEASRKGEDEDGRKYVIKILATDLAGNTLLSANEVIVPHDQRDKK